MSRWKRFLRFWWEGEIVYQAVKWLQTRRERNLELCGWCKEAPAENESGLCDRCDDVFVAQQGRRRL